MKKKPTTAKRPRNSEDDATDAKVNPLSDDNRLRALLKPLLPAGVTLSPLTLEQSHPPDQAEGIAPAMGLETKKNKLKLPFQNKELEVVSVRLHTLQAVVPLTKAAALVTSIQPKLRPHGYGALMAAQHTVAFGGDFDMGRDPATKAVAGTAVLAFFKAAEPYGLLFACGTNGVNLGEGLGTGDIVRRLKQWAGECDCALLGAGSDWVHLRFNTIPKDVARFGGELYLLCPAAFQDEPDEGVPNDVWQHKPKDQDALAPQIGRAFGLSTVADLKPYLGPKKELFLWWD